MSLIDQLTGIVHALRRSDAQSDGDLLAQFAGQRDQAAFAELVRRHGPMVLSVALRHLSDRQAAEDVVQATFLALARRAVRLGRPPSLVNWLYTVAVRQARLARRRNMRQAARIKNVPAPLPVPDPLAEVSGRELLAIIDEELARLPAHYLLPILFCTIEGLPREEVAQRLGWSAGSVKGRLERGRELLRQRLASRGLTVPAALTLGLLTPPAEALSPALAQSLVRAAIVAPLARGSLRLVIAAALALTAIGIGVAGLSDSAPPQPDRPTAPAPAAAIAPAIPAAHVDSEGVPLPNKALVRFGSAKFRHGDRIYSSALSPDGKQLATDAGGSVAVWDLATGQRLHFFRTNQFDQHGHFDFSPNGSQLAHYCPTGIIRLLDLRTGAELRQIEVDADSPGYWHFTPEGEFVQTVPPKVDGVALYSADRAIYVRVDEENRLFVGDARTGNDAMRIGGDRDLECDFAFDWGCTGLALSADGKALAAAVHENKEFEVYDLPGGKFRASFPIPDSARYHAAILKRDRWAYHASFSPDSKTLILGTAGGSIHRWDITSGKGLPVLGKPRSAEVLSNCIADVHVLPGNRTLVSTGWDGRIRFWDLSKNEEVAASDAYSGHFCAACSPDGRLAAVADAFGRVDLCNAADGKRLSTIQQSGPPVNSLAFAPDGLTLAATQGSRVTQLWDVPSGREVKALREEGSNALIPGHTLLFSPDGRSLYVNDDMYFRSRLWDIASGKSRWQAPTAFGAAFCPDGSTLLAGRGGPIIGYLDVATGKDRRKDRLVTNQGDSAGANRPLAVSPDGHWYAAPIIGGEMVVCEVGSGREVLRWQATARPVPTKALLDAGFSGSWETLTTAVAFSPDGQSLATADKFGTICVWDIFTTQKVLQFEGHDTKAPVLAFGPNGRTLFSAGSAGQAFIWSLKPPVGPTGALDALWADLTGDASQAYRAVWALSAERGVEFLRTKLRAAVRPERKRLAELVVSLDRDEFKDRESAARALAEMGQLAVPFLEETLLKQGLGAETRQRVQDLLATAKRWPNAVEVRQLRAVRALELAGTLEAREHLKTLAKGTPEAALTRAASQALKRLGP